MRHLGRLQNHAVSSCDCAYHRTQCQLQRIVPGTHDQYNSIRIFSNLYRIENSRQCFWRLQYIYRILNFRIVDKRCFRKTAYPRIDPRVTQMIFKNDSYLLCRRPLLDIHEHELDVLQHEVKFRDDRLELGLNNYFCKIKFVIIIRYNARVIFSFK